MMMSLLLQSRTSWTSSAAANPLDIKVTPDPALHQDHEHVSLMSCALVTTNALLQRD